MGGRGWAGVTAFAVAFAGMLSTAAAYTVTGTVTDAENKPVPEAAVWLVQSRVARMVATDGKGAFSFPDVEAGPVEVVGRKPGLAWGGLRAQLVGDATVTVVLRKPVERRIRVIGSQFQPVAGARIRALTVGDLAGGGEFTVPIEDLVEAGFPSVRSDEHGVIVFTELPENSFVRFGISGQGFAEQYVPYLNSTGREQDFRVRPGVVVRGRVTDGTGAGVKKARVSVFTITGSGQRELGEVQTDPEGYYHMMVDPGSFYVAAKHPAYAAPQPVHVQTTDDQTESVADLALPAPRDVRGSVVGPDDAPLGGVYVMYLVGETAVDAVYSRSDGTFSLRVPAGDGRLRVVPPDGLMTESLPDILFTIAKETEITLAPIRLKSLPEVTGVVRNPDGTPAPHTLIASMDLSPPLWVVSGEDGRFVIRLARMPQSGTATFRAEHERHLLRHDFTCSLVSPAAMDLVLQPYDPDLHPNDPAHTENAKLEKLVGKAAPDWACAKWIVGESLTPASLKGKVVVLLFWAGFAMQGPGRDQLDEVLALQYAMRDVEDVAFVGIHDASTEPVGVERAVKDLGVVFPVGCDTAPGQTFERYGVSVIPQLVLLDKEGVVRYYDVAGRLPELVKSLRR